MLNIASSAPVKNSTTTVTPCRPTSVSCLVLWLSALLRLLATWLIWCSVTWKGLCSSQCLPWVMPSWRLSDRLLALSITCQTTNQPTSPMTTKPPTKTAAVASPRGTPARLSRATKGWSRAVISRAATKASTTSRIAPMIRVSTQTVPARTSSRQPISAATRMLHGTTDTGLPAAGRGARGAWVLPAGSVPAVCTGTGAGASARTGVSRAETAACRASRRPARFASPAASAEFQWRLSGMALP